MFLLGGVGTSLCLWQWHKAERKEAWQAHTAGLLTLQQWREQTMREAQPDSSPTPEAWLGQQLQVTGKLVPGFSALLDNQIHDGRAGLDVLALLRADSGDYLLVNRGWIPWDERNSLPDVNLPQGTLTLEGALYPFSRPGLTLGDYPAIGDQPVRLPWADRDKLQQALGVTLLNAEFRVAANQPQMFLPHWQLSVISPAKHRAYAWQWAALTLLAWGYALWIVVQTLRRPRNQHRSGARNSNC